MKISCIEITSGQSIIDNIEMIAPMVREAALQGSDLIALPENAFLMASGRKFHNQVTVEGDNLGVFAAKKWAKELEIWLIIGSVAVKNKSTSTKYCNRQLVISPNGKIVARYDKIHLFDVTIDEGESHKESNNFEYGDKAILAKAGEVSLGLSICYDLRFPYLYRSLAKAGAEILTIPAAFTKFTGEKGGWHVMCRARAMETGCFVIAPAQYGQHFVGRQTYGHSLIINPWGEILAAGKAETSIISADIDISDVTKTRRAMPSLNHDREFDLINQK